MIINGKLIMKSNYQSTPIEHLENRRPKCKMHAQKKSLHVFYILQLSTKKTEPMVFFETEPNPQFFSEPNLKNPFRTSLEVLCQGSGMDLTLT